ncbi:N-terminal acetyltransferase A complex subunit nat1 [Sodiomyces alkalinus F11]|uniref:N-terminal acetyltransferase A complex subunit nat1 n=1 Tax=Sodiomyces alkalinus (strain CBS 110278 / VKM F-3762 / F11) TaxID=1314773 RepID=A0A3N2PQH4_SODAK|nr:N-terminal acetyltransferase A complex subunit nat1 [Sodiomyces alkalinus F11]ROT36714.1 N-terminal acetyltransferase A complex subunit nat1 [Sodiomyces alkalinus F11]
MPQPLPPKEAALFRTVVRNYDDKQYKRGLKNADIILKKHPKHGDTTAMKALILNAQGKTDEAFALGKVALMNDMKSSICWHVYGLLWRAVKKYDDAIKAYKQALQIDPDSAQILRDLALLQMQTRDYPGYVQSRITMLQARSQLIQNWTALAVAHHLNDDRATAEKVLDTYESTLKTTPSSRDIEHAEIVMYKNRLVAEQGDYQRALDHLDSAARSNLDRLAVLERRAEYLTKLRRNEEAAAVYRALLNRNPEHPEYYDLLEAVVELGSAEERKKIYDEYAEKYPRADAPRRLPLNFLSGNDFVQAAKEYLTLMLNKGVPSTFANLKHLYSDSFKKETLATLAEEYISSHNDSADATNGDGTKGQPAALYYLAQHYNYHLSRHLDKAMHYVDMAIEKVPQSVEFHMTKARIWKHKGNLDKASEWMERARTLDTRDRYICTKAAKYLLRNNKNEEALKMMGHFTRAETIGGPFMDLVDMQAVWYLTEDGEAFARRGEEGPALRRFELVSNIFDTWVEDQFDFHAFSLRKGFIRAYIDMLRWEDRIREHPFYSRAALDAVALYVKRDDRAAAARANGDVTNGEDAAERKKAAKKAAKEKQKLEREAAERAAKKDPNKGAKDGANRQIDDVAGLKLLDAEPLSTAMKYVSHLLQFSPKNIHAQLAGFDVYIRRKKYVLALGCLNAAIALDASNPKVHERVIEFKHTIDPVLATLPPKVQDLIKSEFKAVPADNTAGQYNQEFLEAHKESPPHVVSAVKARKVLGEDPSKVEKELVALVKGEKVTFEQAGEILEVLKTWKSKEVDTFRALATGRWPQVTIFS